MKRRNDLIVGLAVVIVVVVTVGATLWANQAELGNHHSKVVARFHDVGGVKVGDEVVIRGVQSGRIEAIELAPSGWVHVRMSLDPDVQLPHQPVVLLNESSLFGEWQATITDSASLPHDRDVLQQVSDSRGHSGVLPGATLPDIAKLTAVAGQIAGDVANVSARVQTAFDDQAARELRGSIRNFADLSYALQCTVRAHSGDVDSLSRQLQLAVASLNRTTASTERMASRLDSSTATGDVRHVLSDVAQAASDLRDASAQVKGLAHELAQSQGKLDMLLSQSDSIVFRINSGQGSLGLFVNNPSLYNNGDSLLVQMRDLVADIKANPKRYVNVRVF